MADLLTPKTWTSGEQPTAASVNSGIRDPINRLNGFADTISEATAADSGTAIRLNIVRPAVNSIAFATRETAADVSMFEITAGGQIRWGTGAVATSLYLEREGPLLLRSNSGFRSFFPSGNDTTTYRAFGALVTGDAVGRVEIGKTPSDFGYIGWSTDGNSINMRLRSEDPGTLLLDNPASPSNSVQILAQTSHTGAVHAFGLRRTNDAQARIAIGQVAPGQGGIMFGDGTSSPTGMFIAYTEPGRISTGSIFHATDGIATKLVAGAVANSSYNGTAIDGQVTVSTLGRLYFRYGGAHHYIAETAGFVVPADERVCPQCDTQIEIGERVVGRIDGTQEDLARHGVWEHDTCPS